MACIKKNASFFGLLECHFSRERKVAFLMKIKYEFVDGDVELEVSDEWASVLAELDRQEYNNNQRETRRHTSLDNGYDDGEWLAVENTLLADLIKNEDYSLLMSAIKHLQPQQQELLHRVYWNKEKMSDIAAEQGVSKMAITNRMKKIYKNLKKILE